MLDHQTRKVRVLSLMLCYTGAYQQQYIRPYEITTDNAKRADIIERLDPNRSITPQTVAGAISGFVKPSIQVDPTIVLPIPGGWGSDRFRWVMTLEIELLHNTIVQYMTGYTDYVGASMQNQHLDPRMKFIINNSFQFRVDTVIQNGIPTRRLVPSRLNQVLANHGYDPVRMSSSMNRPQDVLSVIGTAPIRQQVMNQNVIFEGSTLTDRASLNNIANNNPTAYTARLLDAQRRAYSDHEQYGQGFDKIVENAVDYVREDTQRSDPFLARLIASSNETLIGNDFTWADLTRITQNQVLDSSITKVFMRNAVAPTFVPQSLAPVTPGASEDWSHAKYLQQSATVIRDSITSLMAECMFSSIAFNITNETGQWAHSYAGGSLFVPDIDPTEFYFRFIERFKSEIVDDLSFFGGVKFSLNAISDFVGDTRLIISIGDQYGEFVAPTFYGNLVTPVIAGSAAAAINLADGFHNIVTDIHQTFQNKMAVASTTVSNTGRHLDHLMSNFPTTI